MNKKTKLELTWIGKDEQPQLEPRILIEDPGKSYGDKNAENMLIHGDNLLALKALEQDFTGKIKCIFIDPPYNTGSAFQHYDDGVEHSLWLSLMRDRIALLRRLLSRDGSLWITLDDNEHAYCKVLCDEIFGRSNFVASLAWQKKVSPANDALWFSGDHDHILVYAKGKASWHPNRLDRSEEQLKYYSNPDGDPRGSWNSAAYTCAKSSDERPNLYYEITNPNTGDKIWPKKTRVWAYGPEAHAENERTGLVWWGKNGKSKKPRIKRFLKGARKVVPRSVWTYDQTGHTQEARLESLKLFPDDPFSSPKPENLLRRVMEVASSINDVILDSFLGSGTTAAVAHKMVRRWIGVELGEHCDTHCLPRLQQVCDGTDQGGISKAVEWKGGGGFKYYELAPSLLKQDSHGNWVISEEYNADMLAAAMAKHEGFRYCPDSETYWKQGQSSEKDFIFTTTGFVQVAFIDRIQEEMQEDEHLLICCKKFSAACSGRYPSIEIKKIPKMLLGKCEFGREDYSLNIVNMPADEDEPDFVPKGPPPTKKKGRANPAQPDLFGMEATK